MDTGVMPFNADTAEAIELKLRRQPTLQDRAKSFEFLLTESALRWRLCGATVMPDQMAHLIAVSRRPNVRLGVLPLSRPVQLGPMSTFVMYDSRLVTLELYTGLLVLRDPRDVEYYSSVFDFFRKRALWSEAAREFLSEVATDFATAIDSDT